MILSDRDILREIEAGRLAIEPFEREIGRPVLGNVPASGTVIIE